MVRQFFAAISFLSLLLPSSSRSITASWPALEREFQSTVQIWTIKDGSPKYLCSGVIIAPDTVITAASCIYADNQEVKASTLFISTALKIDFKVPITQALQNISAIAKKGIRHPDSDLMLIFLSQPLNIEPSLLLSQNEAFQIRLLNQVILAGYGFREKPIEKSGIWRKWDNLWGIEEGQTPGEKFIAKSRIYSVTSKEIQIGNVPEDGSACIGDEGSPIFAHIDTPFSNSQRVIGIMTSSKQLHQCLHPSSALRLDSFSEFINDKMVQACREGERAWCKIDGLLSPDYNEASVPEKTANPKDEENKKTEAPKLNVAKEEANNPTAEPTLKTEPDSNIRPQLTPKQPKRRLNVSVEGSGCSCQQVFTKRP